MAIYDPTAIRLQLLQNGYCPTPNVDKRCMFKGWASAAFVANLSPESIQAWAKQHRNYKATGILVRDGLLPIDLDINDEAMMEAMLAAVQRIMPEAHDNAPWRTGKPPKLMIFSRWQASTKHPDMFTRLASDKFIDAAGASHQIEVFGGRPSASGGSSKQVGAFGPHSYAEDDRRKVLHEYDWNDGPTPLQVPLAQLPAVTQEQVLDLLEAFESAAEARGWTRQAAPAKAAGSFLYDITETSRFNVMNGPQDIDYDELCAQDIPCRVDGSFIDGSTHRRDKCLVDFCHAKDDVIGVYDYEGGVWHLPKSVEPPTLSGLEPLSDVIGSGELPKGSKRDDFYAFLPTHQYIYKHTGELWAIGGINSTLDKIVIGQKAKKQKKKEIEAGEPPEMVDVTIPASLWLDRHRPVTQLSWAPGLPQVIKGKTISDGGWSDVEGAVIFNRYRPRPPLTIDIDPDEAAPWLALLRKVYPDHADHIINFMAHRVQRPEEKINHALVLTGSPGIGKDTLLEPLKHAVGAWNFKEVSPQDITSNNNDYMQSVVVRISEARDLGDTSRYDFYEKTKTICAAPPDMARVNIKHIAQFYVVNVTGAIITTNYSDGLYLPPDDRRHYVCGTEVTRADFDEAYFNTLWEWYVAGGTAIVATYLAQVDLAGFDAKAPPIKTPAFWRMADAGRAPEEADMRQALEVCGGGDPPPAVTILSLQLHASNELLDWLRDRKNRRNIPRRMESVGYEPVRNADREDGQWSIGGRPQVVYALRSLGVVGRYVAAIALRKKAEEDAAAAKQSEIGTVTPFRR